MRSYPYVDPGWNERRIQQALAMYCLDKGHAPVVPNCGVFGWEADLLSVVPDSQFVHEFEVKTSIEDFRADAFKRKHKYLGKPSATKYGVIGPVYFWYVVPSVLVERVAQELPEIAGLIEVKGKTCAKGTDVCVEVKRAPRLHVVPIRSADLAYLYRGLTLRYWKREREDLIKVL
jgi:hypothetical protein